MSDYCALLEAEADRLIALIDAADPGAPVPSCPGWTLADLAEHVGTTHRWVNHMVAVRAEELVRLRDLPEVTADLPSGGHGPWLRAGVTTLLATLRATGPDERVWTWGPEPRAGFWARRMAHETLMHRVDAELALGREPVIDTATAVDGVEEFLTNLPHARWIAPRLAELDAVGRTAHLHATDADGEWLVTFTAGGPSMEHGHAKGDVAVRGAASDLLLMVYGRLRPDALTVFGDRDLLERWLEKSAL